MSMTQQKFDLSELLKDPACKGLKVELCSKDLVLGHQVLRQFWFNRSSIYGTRRKSACNQPAILDYFRRRVLQDNHAESQKTAAETHLLAYLTPVIRSTGAQRVLPDAVNFPTHGSKRRHFEAVAALENTLQKMSEPYLTFAEFYDLSLGLLEVPEVTGELLNEYRNLESELFAGVLRDWKTSPDTAKETVLKRWEGFQREFSRRSGDKHRLKREVLDVLSYESKAALHQCYSELWQALAQALANREECESVGRFHLFWHCDIRVPTDEIQDIHLMHGHVFALHPAFARLIQTKTGSAVIGAAMNGHRDSTAMRRFFTAACCAINDYMSERGEALSRSWSSSRTK